MIAREIIEEYVLTYDFIDKLNSSNSIAFETIEKQRLNNLILKAKTIGLNVLEVDKEVYAIINANIEQTIDLRGIDTSNITKMVMMFYDINIPNGEIKGLEEFNTSNL